MLFSSSSAPGYRSNRFAQKHLKRKEVKRGLVKDKSKSKSEKREKDKKETELVKENQRRSEES